MTQNDKELLIKDLCSRLPYGVKCRYQHIQYVETGKIININIFGRVNIDGHIRDICDVKPYLFPISSMTEEQVFDFAIVQVENWKGTYPTLSECSAIIDWGYKHHFDVNGLIEKGLAIDATNKNIY